MVMIMLIIFRRRLDKQEKMPDIRDYWDTLHRTSLEDAQPFIKVYMGFCLFLSLIVLVLVLLDWSNFWVRD